MLISVSLVLLAALPFALGDVHLTPANVDWAKHKYKKPGQGDLRGPCPGLNTLANHGFLPRNGKDIGVDTILKAALDGYRIQPEVVTLAAKLGLTTTASPTTFTLEDINLHNSIEHDASISRGDFALGDNHSFNETLFRTLANSNPGVDYYNASSAGEVQRLRLLHSQAVNANLTNTVKEFAIRTGESAFYLSVMENVTTGKALKKYVNIFFREERLPIAEGWKRSAVPIDNMSLQKISIDIDRASRWAPDGKDPSIDVVLDENTIVTL